MPAYVILGNFTEEAMKDFKGTNAMRANMVQALSAKGGSIIWDGLTFGQFDFIAVIDMPGDAATLEMALTAAMSGRYRTQTLKAFSPAEVDQIVARLP